MYLKIKKTHSNSVIPKYATDGSAGLDLTAVSINKTDKFIEYDTGLAMEIPSGYVGLIFPRSSISNYALSLTNCVGVIDSDFRGSILCRFRHLSENIPIYNVGDRVAQIVIVPIIKPTIEVVDDLNETKRGKSGFGSTGK